MWDRILELLPVGCRHRHMSLPFSSSTATRKHADGGGSWDKISSEDSKPYVVCLDCGKHFEYDWSRMRVVK